MWTLVALSLLLPPASAPAQVTGDPVLWKATAPGKKPTYLFGTLHVGIALDELDPAVRSAFAESETLVTETWDAEPPPVDSLLMPEGETLPRLLSRKGWSNLRKELSGTVPADVLPRLKPGVAFAVLEQKYDKFADSPKMDRQLLERAKAAKKAVEYLETPEQQSGFLDRAVTPACLDAFATRTKQFLAQNAALARSYRTGDPVDDDSNAPECEEMKEVLNLSRTKDWMPKLESYIAKGGTFVAVGCLHLVGPEGAVARFAAKGVKLERVRAASP